MRVLVRKAVLVVSDVLLVNAAVLLSFLIRFDGQLPDEFLIEYKRIALLFTTLSVLGFGASGLYSSLWRYASIDEIFIVLKGTVLSTGILVSLTYILPEVGRTLNVPALVTVQGFPRSVTILVWLISTVLIGGLRFSFRSARRLLHMWRDRRGAAGGGASASDSASVLRQRVLIVGAGDAGSMVVRELASHGELGYEPIGFLDDDAKKQGMRIHGHPVLGARRDLPDIIRRMKIDEIIIAMPSAPGAAVREIVKEAQALRMKVKTVPGLYELLDGKVGIQQIREVQIEDLLGREPVAVDLGVIAGYLRGERVLVTGAGGSIGSELCRQIAQFQPAELLLLDNSENGLFEISMQLQFLAPELLQRVIVADIRDREKIDRVFGSVRPQVVFHAAAHKHVPLMEHHPDEAVKTNIIGTMNVAQAARSQRAKRFVMISTDKAVNPTNVMGASKRLAEMTIQSMDLERRRRDFEGTRFVAVRFGNVLGSRGSVVPVFKEQIARGGPVTVTHPEMRRYFMTIPEAVQLVIQAGAMGEGGELFVLDMGEPVRIVDLAENLIRLSGFEPGVDIPIVFTEPRPGEKLSEEILTSEEGAQATKHRRIFVCHTADVEPAWLERQVASLYSILQQRGEPGKLVTKLREVVAVTPPAVALPQPPVPSPAILPVREPSDRAV